MRDYDFRVREKAISRVKPACLGPLFAVLVFTACGKSDAPNASAARTPASSSAAPASPIAGGPQCPATGRWAKCSILYRLEREGLAPRVDSTAKPDEKRLAGQSFVVKIGRFASLDVFVYADSTARKADAARLDTTEFVSGTAQQTLRRERTLIVNNNLVALLTSLDARQRERVSDALMAGAPQPSGPQTVAP
ncbi:MAG TPA: hypothetical protein VH277_02035 [Gemmatimonadaceae bacterium]|jgi:hypothetical protein|nr:hypothetical protein [Gemmatimonadaceae bacterium]